MDPNQPPSNAAPSPDYLSQIAPQAPKRKLFEPGIKLWAMIGATLIVLVIIFSLVFNATINAQRRPLQQLSARLSATATVVDSAQDNLKSSKLRSLNSNLKIYLTNTNRDIGAPFLAAGVNVANIPDSIKKDEAVDDVTARLENARLNVVYDNTYAREMTRQLESTTILMQQIISGTSNRELKTFLESAYDNLIPTQEEFAAFNGVN